MNDEPKDFDIDTGDQASHKVPFVSSVKDEHEDALQFESSFGSPSVLGEEDVVSGSATSGEPEDIDKALAAVGLPNDDNGRNPLGE